MKGSVNVHKTVWEDIIAPEASALVDPVLRNAERTCIICVAKAGDAETVHLIPVMNEQHLLHWKAVLSQDFSSYGRVACWSIPTVLWHNLTHP